MTDKMMGRELAEAVRLVRPGAQFVTVDGVITEWHSDGEPPSEAEIEAAVETVRANALIEAEKNQAKEFLESTDWLVIRAAETGEPIPEDVAALRAQAREVWTPPSGAHNVYMKGDQVEVDGVIWESLLNFNVWQPGTSGWREVVEDDYPAWLQPTGAHDAYAIGDRVTHNGATWESTAAANVWEPGVFGWVEV